MFTCLLSFLAFLGLVSAQAVGVFFNYPPCVQQCLYSLAPRFCPLPNNACLCPNTGFVTAWTNCAKSSSVCNQLGQENSWQTFVYNCGTTGFAVNNLRPAGFGYDGTGKTTVISIVAPPPSPDPPSPSPETSPEDSPTPTPTPTSTEPSPTPTERDSNSSDDTTPTPSPTQISTDTPMPEETLGPASSLSAILDSLPTRLPDSCGGADWDPTPSNWDSEDVDAKLLSWWNSVKSKGDFVEMLFKSFGGKTGGVQCGVGYVDTCPLPSCESFRTSKDPKWAYFTQVAVVRMNTLFNNVYTGITYGQVDLNSLIPHLVSIFIPYKDTRSKLQKALPYIGMVFEALVGIIPFAGPAASSSVKVGIAKAGKKLAEAGVATLNRAADKRNPDPTVQRDGNIEDLGVAIMETSDLARKTLEDWFTTLLSGKEDPTGRTILDYLQTGAYTLPLKFTLQEITTFYTHVEVAKVWSEQVRNNTYTFGMCATTTGPKHDDESEYYDSVNGKRCRLYRLDNKANYVKLFGVDGLAQFNITASDVSGGSWNTYKTTKTKFTNPGVDDQIVFDDSLTAAYASNSPEDEQPLNQGVKFGGVFNIPVCDVGTQEDWLSGDNYPCCCGDGCKDQSAFMEAARMGGWKKVVDGCKKQYDGWKNVDYGSGGSGLFMNRYIMWLVLLVATAGVSMF